MQSTYLPTINSSWLVKHISLTHLSGLPGRFGVRPFHQHRPTYPRSCGWIDWHIWLTAKPRNSFTFASYREIKSNHLWFVLHVIFSSDACRGVRQCHSHYTTHVFTAILVPKQMARFEGFHCVASGNLLLHSVDNWVLITICCRESCIMLFAKDNFEQILLRNNSLINYKFNKCFIHCNG